MTIPLNESIDLWPLSEEEIISPKLTSQRCKEIVLTDIQSNYKGMVESIFTMTLSYLQKNKMSENVVTEFCLTHPSHEYNLMCYGGEFSRFLAAVSIQASELAHFEYTLHLLNYAPLLTKTETHSFQLEGRDFSTRPLLFHYYICLPLEQRIKEERVILFFINHQGSADYLMLSCQEEQILQNLFNKEGDIYQISKHPDIHHFFYTLGQSGCIFPLK